MWQPPPTPIANSLPLSALVAALPVVTLLILLGVMRKPAWIASLCGLGAAVLAALFGYQMPVANMLSSVAYGAAFGLFPIGWIVFSAIMLYRITVDTGKFEIIKDSIGGLTDDHRLQALLIAFAFGAFIEGAAGFGTPVAVAAAMLTGLGFSPFYAAGICLLANTAPVAFGSIGIPLITLQGITGLPMHGLSSNVGRICAPVSLFIPAYLIVVMSGFRGLMGVLPAAAVCGLAFGGSQFLVSNFLGPYLTDIIGSLSAIVCMVILLRVWKPAKSFQLDGHESHKPHARPAGEVMHAWSPYALLVVFVVVWGYAPVKAVLEHATMKFAWPLVKTTYTFNVLSASGTACMFATVAAAIVLGVSPRKFVSHLAATAAQLKFSLLTIASVLALAFLMNFSGATTTLGLFFAATGAAFPFFSALLGWLGVFLTGSDTSANALFGKLQVVTAGSLNLNPVLMAASNSSGGVMGKMISLQSIAVAAAATGMPLSDESRLFRFTLRHSIFLASLIGLVVLFYAYVMPAWAPR
ncbi:MAG: L-lactate permease [Acidobacteria bacterium]|nr:L-lactate permease [Acidobacteriota bacterium]